ncbi:glycoside hydrolase family 104 protein [Candidatus Woesearchaeota archaeon]|nr:glycoside hydrolase family 104 protein [Candidatus Woesearchaeota archaeon]
MKKRGAHSDKFGKHASMLHESLFFLFQMVLVLFVFIALLQFVNNVATDVGFNKRYTSIDLGLMVTALSASPGTIKQSYSSIHFPVPFEADFAGSIVSVGEVDKPLKSAYWFLADLNMDIVAFQLRSGLLKQDKTVTKLQELVSGEQKEIHLIDATFYKSPGRLKSDEMKVNPVQLSCPSFNTTDVFWDQQKKVLIAKIFASKAQFADGNLPLNRIAQILSAQSTAILVNVQTKAAPAQESQAQSQPAGSALSSSSKPVYTQQEESAQIIAAQETQTAPLIPSADEFAQADMIIVLGTTASADAAGALRAYIPAAQVNSMKSRKLACLIINKLLTPATEVSFVQVLPVFKQQADKKSPLQALFAVSDEQKPIIFLDLGSFAANEINVENAAYAIFNGVHRYYDSNKSILLTAPPIVIGGLAAAAQTAPKAGIGPTVPAGLAAGASELHAGAEGIYTLAMKGGDPYIRAFMRAITVGEGTKAPTKKCPDPYRIIVGGGCFEGTSHPNQVVKLTASLSSSAAGRYQFLSSTWKNWANQYGVPLDQFTPENQDKVVYKELERLGVGKMLAENNLDAALKRTNGIWASLPGSKYGQRTEKRDDFERFYNALLAEEKGQASGAGSTPPASPGLIASNPPAAATAST